MAASAHQRLKANMSRNAARSVPRLPSRAAELLQIMTKHSLVDYFVSRVLVRSVFVNYFHDYQGRAILLLQCDGLACLSMAHGHHVQRVPPIMSTPSL
jgi:hypothetical protein